MNWSTPARIADAFVDRFALPYSRERHHNLNVLLPFINIPFIDINLYQKPVDTRWGPTKLIEICRRELGREPQVNELFLFFNAARNTLRLVWRDGTGTHDIAKVLPRAGFMLPAPKVGHAFVPIKRTMLEKLFRSTGGAHSPTFATPAHADPAREQRVLDAGFVEISPTLLRSMLASTSHPPPKRAARVAQRKTGLKAENVLRFESRHAPAKDRKTRKSRK